MSIDDPTGLPTRTHLPPLSKPPAADFDESKYLPLIEEFEMSEVQKVELLKTLWSIMCSFVELGLPVDICGQVFSEIPSSAEPSAAGVDSSHAMKSPPAVSDKGGALDK